MFSHSPEKNRRFEGLQIGFTALYARVHSNNRSQPSNLSVRR
jgi:hypothetical protein